VQELINMVRNVKKLIFLMIKNEIWKLQTFWAQEGHRTRQRAILASKCQQGTTQFSLRPIIAKRSEATSKNLWTSVMFISNQ
jgi:hypothetical protein